MKNLFPYIYLVFFSVMKSIKIIRNILFKTTRRILFFVFVILAFGISIFKPDLRSLRPETNISCQYVYQNDTLPLLERNSSLPSRSIFFYVTSCPGNLTSRHSCAVESASRTHPEWQTNVVFSGPVLTETLENVAHLQRINNVKFWRVHIADFFNETPFDDLESWYSQKYIWDVLIGDVLKYLTLYTWSGMYFDLDIMVARPLDSLVRNWVTRDSEGLIDEGILVFSKDSVGRNVSEMAIKEMHSILKRGEYNDIRPAVMMATLQQFCSTPDATYMSSATCNGFEVYGPQFFSPIPKDRARVYFRSGDLQPNNAYTYHLWEPVTKAYKITVASPYAKLAKRYCPITFRLGLG